MRWQTLQAQLERALATAEATLSLLREQLSLQEQRRQFDREHFDASVKSLHDDMALLNERTERLILKDSEGTSAYMQSLHSLTMSKLTELGEKLDLLYEQTGVPHGDTPTIEEMIAQAKSQPALRKQLETTLAELEFSDPQIEFN